MHCIGSLAEQSYSLVVKGREPDDRELFRLERIETRPELPSAGKDGLQNHQLEPVTSLALMLITYRRSTLSMKLPVESSNH